MAVPADMANHSFTHNVEVRPTDLGMGLFATQKVRCKARRHLDHHCLQIIRPAGAARAMSQVAIRELRGSQCLGLSCHKMLPSCKAAVSDCAT